jgi:uncharacterized protein
MTKDFLLYVKNPCVVENKKFKIEVFFSMFFTYLLVSIPIGILVYVLCHVFKLEKKEINLTAQTTFILGVVLAPIYEEIIFRSLLKFNKRNLYICLFTLLGAIIIFFLRSKIAIVIILAIFFIFLVGLTLLFPLSSIEATVSKKFKSIFYAVAIIFGLLHAFNFIGNLYYIIALSLLLGSPQIVLGLILGYLRVNYGLVYSILFHMVVNLSIIFSIIRGQ